MLIRTDEKSNISSSLYWFSGFACIWVCKITERKVIDNLKRHSIFMYRRGPVTRNLAKEEEHTHTHK